MEIGVEVGEATLEEERLRCCQGKEEYRTETLRPAQSFLVRKRFPKSSLRPLGSSASRRLAGLDGPDFKSKATVTVAFAED
jgi:hypothetical protein